MRTELKTLALLFALSASMPMASAATENGSNSPFDFSYRISGASSLRPTLVFNDGRDTYIEFDQDVRVSAQGGAYSFRQGPYYVVRGLQPEIVLSAKREQVSITYEPRVSTVPVKTPAPATPPPVTEDSATLTAATTVAPEKTAPACTPKAIQSESSVLVAFAASNARLSSEAESTLLREARVRDALLEKVRIRMPEGIGATKLGGKRQQYLADLLVSVGIPRVYMNNEYGATYNDATEIIFINGTDKPCAKRPPVVRMQEGFLTVISHDADIATLLQAIGEAMAVRVRIEGEAREISVAIAVAAERPASALARIGAAVGDQAVIVLRDKELVLRFN